MLHVRYQSCSVPCPESWMSASEPQVCIATTDDQHISRLVRKDSYRSFEAVSSRSALQSHANMPVRIRLASHGQRNTPFFHIVAIKNTKRRDAKPIETLGTYDPIPRIPEGSELPPSAQIFFNRPRGSENSSSGSSSSKSFLTTGQRNAINNGKAFEGIKKEKRIEWNVERIKELLGQGAQPSDTVVKLLERVCPLSTPPV